MALLIIRATAAASTTIAARKIMLSLALMSRHITMLQISISGALRAMRRHI